MHNMRKMTLKRIGALLLAGMLLLCGTIPETKTDIRAEAFENSDYTDDYGEFLYSIGRTESGNSYAAESGQFLGYWQMGNAALQEAGFLDSSGNWTELAAAFGITSRETFLTSEAGQDYAVLAYHKRVYHYAKYMGVESYIGSNVNGVNMNFAGMIVAAHALGVGGLKKLIETGTSGNSSNDSVALLYMENYGVYNIEDTIKGEMPPVPEAATTTTTTTTTTAAATTTTTTTTTTITTTTTTSTTAASTTSTIAASSSTTPETSTATSALEELKPPAYIKVKPQYDVCEAGEILEIYIESDSAEKYEIKILMPGGKTAEYKLSGTMIGVVMPVIGICEIQVKGINDAGSASAESVYVSVKEKVIVNEENIGDSNNDGSVNITDATIILRYYSCLAAGVSMNHEGGFNRYYADANGDGSLDLTDAGLVLKYYSQRAAGFEPNWSDLLSQ